MTISQANPLHGSLEAAVRTHAMLRGDATVLLAPARTPCSYGQLATHLDRLRTALAERMPADHRVIAVAGTRGPDALAAIVAAMSNGICAPFDPSRPPAEIDAFLADVMPALVLADETAILRHREALARYGVGVMRMITTSAAPAGVFEVRVEESYQQRKRPACADDVALLLRTSGTTAMSKIVPHTTRRLMHIFTSIVDGVNLQPSDRCLNAAPLHHVHAITHVVGASLVAGASVVCTAEIGAAALVDGLRTYKPTWYTASPAVHRDVLACARRETAPLEHALRFIRSTAAALDRQVAVDLEAALGAPVLESYGTTEAPSSTLNRPPPFGRKLGSVGRPLGCEIAIFDGEVAIRGANVAPRYAGGERRPIVDPVTGWYRTGDAGRLDADGYLYITGRLDELINVGGEKVAPDNVEQVLRAHPGVADAVAFALPHPTLGQHVAVAVVARTDAVVTERGLIEYAALFLSRPAVPNAVHVVAAIARDGSGKARRHELTARFARDSQITPIDPNDGRDGALLAALTRIWEDVLEYAPVAIDQNFIAAGGDSLRAIRVMTRIESDLGVRVPMDVLAFASTIRELAQAVRTQTLSARRNRLVALRATGSRPPLFFFHSDASGGGWFGRLLAAALDVEQPIYLVGPYGARDDDVPESIELMADADAAMIAAAVPSHTYRLAGFCSGGVVAFEVARRLQNAGSRVDVVTLIASSAPNALLDRLWTWKARAGSFLSERNQVRLYKALRSIANAVRTRSYPVEIFEALYYLWHPTPPMADDIRIYSERLLRYFPQRSALSVDLIWPDDDRLLLSGDPSMGWCHVARVRRHCVRGDHTTVLTDHSGELGTALRRIFDTADG